MELIPHDEFKPHPQTFNFAPMIDFLFLMLALFATLAISRAALFDTEIALVKLKPEKNASSVRNKEMHRVNLSVTKEGKYKWLTEFQEYDMDHAKAVQAELGRQHEIGAIPEDKGKTEVLLHIDEKAPWDAIANLLFAVKEVGFDARPVYEGEG